MRALRNRGITPQSTEAVVQQAQFLSVHAPLGEHTRHLVDDTVLQPMKPGAFPVSMSRVDYAAKRPCSGR
jgi:D-3-phosphoglycerate dehydrogenase / 2-oxoglutarate reductase